MDFIAPYVPIGLGSVRVGNFLNSELLGRPTEVQWGVIFPSDPLGLVRHPSQLYQAFGEGVVLLIFMLWFIRRPRPHMATSSVFLIGYGVIRCFTEIFREPDIHLGLFFNYFSLGTLLSMTTLILGLVIIITAKKNEQNN